jgi:hypothetical protein
MQGNGPLVVREKFHAAAPMGIDQALFEMELVGHDFFLFTDAASGLSSVVYRRRGYQYGVIRLLEENAAGPAEETGRDRTSGRASVNGEATSARQGSAASRGRGASGGRKAGGQAAADPE